MVRQLLVESCLIAAAGAALGVLVARWCIPLLLRLSPEQVPDVGTIGVDPRVVLFVGLISLLAVALFGSWPAVLASRSAPAAAIKAAGPSLAGTPGAGLRKLLIAVEAGLAVLLLTAAGLFAKSFARLAQVDLGFDPRGVLAMRLSLPSRAYSAPEPVTVFAQRLGLALGSLPGVDAVGVISSLPLSGTWAADDFTIAGRPPLKTSETPSAQYRVVNPAYFQAMAVPLVAGRVFGEGDRLETRPVAIVNKAMAARFWPHASPLGAHLKLGGYAPAGGDAEVVGVVGDVKHLQIDEEPTYDVYVPLRQASTGYLPYLVNGMWWVVRSAGRPGALAAPVRAAVRAADPDVATSRMAPLSRFVGDAVALRRFNAWLAGVFGAAAVLLAALGIYGVIAFSVTQRQREIGLRMAFGARPAGILRLVITQGLTLAIAGVAGGVLASLLLTRLTARLLYGIGANDAATLWQAACVLLGTALLACWLPARRAASVDPMVTLRHE
ncbi:MAG TPA: FtsX-like permease family protein [Thermoanaerobaculia bacterium]|nr:FtsX-like permease family protein [Thermoanaerobaculia bacterium]